MFIDYLESVLGEAKWNTAYTEANWDCPFCTDSRTRFRMNKYSLKGHCFNCNWGGNAITFVRDFQKITWNEALDVVNFYQDFRPLPENVYDEVFDQIYLEDYEVEKRPIPLPKDFKLLHNTQSVMADKFYKYARKRRLTDKQIELHGVGFCPEGEIKLSEDKTTFLRNRLIMQAFDDDNNAIYWNARAISKKLKPKSINPTSGVNTINKSDVVFNLNNAKKHGVVVVTEGIFDAATVGDFGVDLFGKTLAVKQLMQLIRADLEAAYIMLDPDALEDAIKMGMLLSKHIPTYLCNLKGGDPNEVGRKGCAQALRDAEKFDRFTALKYKLFD